MSTKAHQNNIRFYRTLNELSYAKTGELLRKKGETIMRIETGISSPTLEVAYQLADLFNVEFHELFFREGSEPQKRIVYINRERNKKLSSL